jgi:hypothetical protein
MLEAPGMLVMVGPLMGERGSNLSPQEPEASARADHSIVLEYPQPADSGLARFSHCRWSGPGRGMSPRPGPPDWRIRTIICRKKQTLFAVGGCNCQPSIAPLCAADCTISRVEGEYDIGRTNSE